MFIVFLIIGALVGSIYGSVVLPKIIGSSHHKKVISDTEDQICLSLISAITAPTLGEFFMEWFYGPTIDGHTGIWGFLDHQPEWLNIGYILLVSLAGIFFFIAYVLFPLIWLLGFIIVLLEKIQNLSKFNHLADKLGLSSYQLKVTMVFLILIVIYIIITLAIP